MDPLQKLDRGIKILVAMITLAAAALIGLRVVASRSLRVSPKQECEAVGRTFDTQRHICLPR